MYDVLINDGIFSFVDKNKLSGSRELYFAFPVVAFKIEISSRVSGGNPIRNAIDRLNKYYRSPEYIKYLNGLDDREVKEQSGKTIPMKIAEDLDLTEELVKRVIEREELQKELSLPRGEAEGEAESESCGGGYKKIVNAYAVFDMLSKRFLPWVVDEQEFDGMKREVEDLKKYRVSLGDSDLRKIIGLRTNDDNYPIGEPSQTETERLVKRAYGGSDKCRFTVSGYGERFLLTTCCFYAKNNPYSYCATNPFKQEPAQWMRQLVEEWSASPAAFGSYVAGKLAEVKPTVRADSAPKNKTERELDERFDKCAALSSKANGKTNGEVIAWLLPRFKALFLAYVALWQTADGDGGEGLDYDGEKKGVYEALAIQNYLIALYTFFEEAFKVCAICNNRLSDRENYYSKVENLYGDDGNGPLLSELAAEIGFADRAQILKKERFKREDVTRLIEGSLIGGQKAAASFSASAYLNLLEAAFNGEHPFRRLQNLYPDLLTLAVQTRKPRNKAKHGNVYDLGENYQDFYHIAADVFQTVCGIPDGQFETFPCPEDYVHIKELREDFDRAYAATKEEIAKYDRLKENADLRVQATIECISFSWREGEYLAKLSNLYDEILTQLIGGCTGLGARIDAELVKRQLNGKSVFGRAMEILHNARVYPMGRAPDKSQFGRSWILREPRKLENISPRNKLLYYIFCVNAIAPRLYRDEAFRKSLFGLSESVCETSEARGHNERADFKISGRRYEEMHAQALSLCNELCKYIKNN